MTTHRGNVTLEVNLWVQTTQVGRGKLIDIKGVAGLKKSHHSNNLLQQESSTDAKNIRWKSDVRFASPHDSLYLHRENRCLRETQRKKETTFITWSRSASVMERTVPPASWRDAMNRPYHIHGVRTKNAQAERHREEMSNKPKWRDQPDPCRNVHVTKAKEEPRDCSRLKETEELQQLSAVRLGWKCRQTGLLQRTRLGQLPRSVRRQTRPDNNVKWRWISWIW